MEQRGNFPEARDEVNHADEAPDIYGAGGGAGWGCRGSYKTLKKSREVFLLLQSLMLSGELRALKGPLGARETDRRLLISTTGLQIRKESSLKQIKAKLLGVDPCASDNPGGASPREHCSQSLGTGLEGLAPSLQEAPHGCYPFLLVPSSAPPSLHLSPNPAFPWIQTGSSGQVCSTPRSCPGFAVHPILPPSGPDCPWTPSLKTE